MCVCKCTLTSVCASAFPTLQLKTKTFEFPWPSPGLPSESGNVDESFPLPPCTQSDSMALPKDVQDREQRTFSQC